MYRTMYHVIFHEPGHPPRSVGEHPTVEAALIDAQQRARGNDDTHYAWEIKNAAGLVEWPLGHFPSDFVLE